MTIGRRGRLDFGRESKRRQKEDVSIVRKIVSWVFSIFVVVVVAAAAVGFFGFKTTNQGQSMSPTLESGDEVLVDRIAYVLSDPKPNDLIAFLPNGNEKSHYYIKRIIAVPGDTVLIKNGVVYVNDEPFEEEIDDYEIEDEELAAEEIVLDSGEYFVLGDNRNNSEDSRHANIGNIKSEYIIGKVWFCLSKDRFGKL